MARSLSLQRRRVGLVDLTLPVRANVSSYQFQSATNFDGSYTTFATIPATGAASATIQDLGIDGSSRFRGKTRFLFNPSDYSLDDTKPLWVRIKQVSTAGVVGTAEAGQLILPYSSAPNRPIVLAGTAPSAADITGSLEIQLPYQCQNVNIKCNTTGRNLYVAFEPNGTEFAIPNAVDTAGYEFHTVIQSVTQLFVRGDTGTAVFNVVLSLRNNPSI